MRRASKNCICPILSGIIFFLASGCGPSSSANRPAAADDQKEEQGVLTGARTNRNGPTRRASAQAAGNGFGESAGSQGTSGKGVILNEVVDTFRRIKEFHDAVNSASKTTKSDMALVIPSHTEGRQRD